MGVCGACVQEKDFGLHLVIGENTQDRNIIRHMGLRGSAGRWWGDTGKSLGGGEGTQVGGRTIHR